MSDQAANLILSETVHSALVLAATDWRLGGRLHTGPVLDALARVNVIGDWDRLWLYAGQPDQIGLAFVMDPEAGGGDAAPRSCGTWEGVPLSAAMSESMALLARLAEAYSMRPVPPGVLALALVAAPLSGAARALTAHGRVTLDDLLETIQSDLLGSQLTGLDQLLAQATPAGRQRFPQEDKPPDARSALEAAQALAGRRSADDLDLLQVLDRGEVVAGALAKAGIEPQALAEVATVARSLGSRAAAEVIAQAEFDADTNLPTDTHIMVTATASPSPAMARMLRVFGSSGSEIAAAAGMANLKRVVSGSTHFWSVLNFVAIVASGGAVIAHVITSGAVWQLVLLLFIGVGPPSTITLWSFVVSGLFWFLAGPLVGSAKLAETVISVWLSRAERRDILRQTGVWLTESEHNRLRQRQREFRAALINSRHAYFFMARLRRLERAARRAADQQHAGAAA